MNNTPEDLERFKQAASEYVVELERITAELLRHSRASQALFDKVLGNPTDEASQ